MINLTQYLFVIIIMAVVIFALIFTVYDRNKEINNLEAELKDKEKLLTQFTIIKPFEVDYGMRILIDRDLNKCYITVEEDVYQKLPDILEIKGEATNEFQFRTKIKKYKNGFKQVL